VIFFGKTLSVLNYLFELILLIWKKSVCTHEHMHVCVEYIEILKRLDWVNVVLLVV
jgi:hypothetical protein